jgi:hypothetical protein
MPNDEPFTTLEQSRGATFLNMSSEVDTAGMAP